MKLIDVLTTKVTERFVNAQVEGTGKLAPRNGYYYIRNVQYENVGLHGQVPIAEVNWKESSEEKFIEEALFRIALSSLASANPNQTQHLTTVDALVNQVIKVSHASIVSKMFKGVERKTLQCVWYLIDEKPVFMNTAVAAIQSFFGNAQSGREAFDRLVSNAPYDVLAKLEYEAKNVVADAVIEDVSDDLFDAPDSSTEEDDESRMPSKR